MNFEEKSTLYPESGQARTCPVTTPLEKTLLILLAIGIATAAGLLIAIAHIHKVYNQNLEDVRMKLKNESNVCYTPSCISEASNLMKSIDLDVDPCTDFYSFVCGNWIKNAYLVSNLESQFTKLTRIIILRVKGILEDLQKDTDLPDHKKKAADFYKSCTNKAHRNAIGAEELLTDLKKFGGWPVIEDEWDASTFDWVDLMVMLFRKGYVNNLLFSVKVDIDIKNTSTSLITISQPSLGLINKIYYVLPHTELITSYKDAIFKLAKLLKSDLDKEKTRKAIDDAFKIESKLAHLTREVNMNIPDYFYNIMTLKELKKFAPMIPWKKLLRGLLPPDTDITDDERIMITAPSMIKGLNDLLEEMNNKAGQRALANYMFYRTVFHASLHLSREFYLLVNDVFDTDRVGPTQLWETCIRITMQFFPLPLTASYVDRYMDDKKKDLVEMMFEDLRNALIDSIEHASWLDEETKQYALLKVKKMRSAIGYRDEIMDDEKLNLLYENVNITDSHFSNVKQLFSSRLKHGVEGLHEKQVRFRWSTINNLLTANAYYQPGQNSIIIPVGLLQDPVFASERPNYINYGSLGMIVAHELTHAFDSIGGLYDAEGSYRMWWSQNSWKKFQEKTKCYEKQYSEYYIPEADTYINGTLTLGENIADNGGLRTAYYAYNKLLKRNGTEKLLPGLPYNEKQLFWISFALVWCRKQTEDSIVYSVKHSVHTPSKFRVIGSLSNMKEFSEDFNCKSNSTMNPVSRCFLWK